MAKIQLSRFGEILDAIRAERGDLLRDVAQRYGYNETTIGDARRFPMKHKPHAALLADLADYTGMAINEIVAAMHDDQMPPVGDIIYPLVTRIGIQYQPTRILGDGGCDRCEYLDRCRHYVVDMDGFALCEDLIPADVLTPEDAAIVASNYQEDRLGNRVRAVA